mgnify:CR=1 FL=1
MVLQARKIAVSCKPLFHQGRGLSKNKTARLDFEKKCGVHRFCSDTPIIKRRICGVFAVNAHAERVFGDPLLSVTQKIFT